jgi:hypothetical protein
MMRPFAVAPESGNGPSRHFIAAQQSRRYRGKADIGCRAHRGTPKLAED